LSVIAIFATGERFTATDRLGFFWKKSPAWPYPEPLNTFWNRYAQSTIVNADPYTTEAAR
ncbi:MAG: hypothetical protein ACYC1J_10265, partial [Acidithiobacillus ferrooxidans]